MFSFIGVQFGIFCVFDGHAGRAAAENASRMMPHNLSSLLQEEDTRATVLREGNAADLLRAAFHRTEAMLPNEDEVNNPLTLTQP